jgi:pimeloyl-ACP methyl ester carboxylesterase
MSPTLPQGFHEGYAETPLGRVHYVSGGRGSPLFLIHGGYGGWAHWHANLLPLAQAHTVFAIDMPGFGQSCDAAADARIDSVAQSVWDAIAAMRETLPDPMRGRPIHIAAFSFGTVVAAKIALEKQDDVRALLLINPPGLGEVSQEVREIQARASDTARSRGLRAGIDITLRELMLCQPARTDGHALDLLEGCVRNTRLISRSLSRATRLPPMLDELRMPVHVVLGERDPHQRHELALRRARLEKTLGASNVHVFANAAHWLQYDQPERFAALALAVFNGADCSLPAARCANIR